MKIGKYKVKFNYTILRGFLDIVGLLLAYLILKTTLAFIYQTVISPTRELMKIYPEGVPVSIWLPGLIFPTIALGVMVFTVVFMLTGHRIPAKYRINAKNAQKYYDTIMIANSLLRILALLALWDNTYIHQSNLLFDQVSWLSIQTVMDIAVGVLIIYITDRRVKTFAEVIPKDGGASADGDDDGEESPADGGEENPADGDNGGQVKIKIKKSDDDEMMRS